MPDKASTRRVASSTVEFCRDSSRVLRGESTEEPSKPGAEYAAFLKDLLEAEEKRSTGMETRALAVVTSSGALVTLLLALAALVTRVQQARLPGFALSAAAVAAVLLVLSALCAGLANAPWTSWGLRPECLRTELWERWDDQADHPVAKIAATRLRLWEECHRLTQRKAALVFTAAMLQAAGAVALTTAAVSVLASA